MPDLTFLLRASMRNTCSGQRAMKYVIFFNIRITVCRPHLPGLSVVPLPELLIHHELTWGARDADAFRAL